MVRSLLLSLALSTAAVGSAADCNVEFEFAYLADNTQGMGYLSDGIKPHVKDMLRDIQTLYPNSKFGLSYFSDKPIPFSGFGGYGGYGEGYAWDFCYYHLQKMTSSAQQFYQSWTSIWPMGGDDIQENTLGAIYDSLTDPNMGWTDRTMNEGTGAHVVKVLVIGTDAIPHVSGDALANTNYWNELWGTMDMPYTSLMYGDCYLEGPVWARVVELATRFRADPASLTAEESVEFQELTVKCGPWPWPDVFSFTKSSDPMICSTTEYPTLAESFLPFKNSANPLFPIFINSEPEMPTMTWIKSWGGCPEATTEAACVREFWELASKSQQVEGYFYSVEGRTDMDGAGVAAVNGVMDALFKIKEKMCDGQTTGVPTAAPEVTTTTIVTEPTTTTTVTEPTTTTTVTEPTTTTTVTEPTTTTTVTEPTTTTTVTEPTTTTTVTEPTTTTTVTEPTTTTTVTEPTTTTTVTEPTTTTTVTEPTTTTTVTEPTTTTTVTEPTTTTTVTEPTTTTTVTEPTTTTTVTEPTTTTTVTEPTTTTTVTEPTTTTTVTETTTTTVTEPTTPTTVTKLTTTTTAAEPTTTTNVTESTTAVLGTETTIVSTTGLYSGASTSPVCECEEIRKYNAQKLKELGLKEKAIAKFGSLEGMAQNAIAAGLGGAACAAF